MHTECCEFKGGHVSCWYKIPTTTILGGLIDLLHDVDVMKMTELLDRNGDVCNNVQATEY